MNDLIRVKLKEILNFVKHEGRLSRGKADNKQSNFANELRIFKGTKNI